MNTLFGSLGDIFRRIAGFQTSRNANSQLWAMRPQRDARIRWDDNSRYTGDKLREIRKRKGVGRPSSELSAERFQAELWRGLKFYPALACAMHGLPSPNLAEWNRKQRRGETAEAWRDRILADTLAKIQASLGEMGYEKAT